MKKYLVFFGFMYYPEKGIYSLLGSAETIELAKVAIDKESQNQSFIWWQIVDRDSLEIVEEGADQ